MHFCPVVPLQGLKPTPFSIRIGTTKVVPCYKTLRDVSAKAVPLLQSPMLRPVFIFMLLQPR